MVLDAPLRNHDHQGGSRGRAEKNCFIDKRGNVWALDYDGGPPLSFSMPSFPRSPLEECTLGVWGSSLSNVHCTVVIAAWHKLSPIYPNTSEIALLNFMKQSAYWQLLQACPVKAATKDEFLLSAFGQRLLRLHSQRSFPWNAVRNVPVLGSGPTHNNAVKGKDEQLLQGQKCEVYPRKAEGESEAASFDQRSSALHIDVDWYLTTGHVEIHVKSYHSLMCSLHQALVVMPFHVEVEKRQLKP
eukprot:scaffold221_cov351-Pavlova_lutheri.AAC.37